MSEPNLRKTDLKQLAVLWQQHDDISVDWRSDELAAIFDHLWTAPLADELAKGGPDSRDRQETRPSTPDQPPGTLRELLEHPQPPLDLSEQVKEFAKRARRDKSLPVDVAAVVYSAAICAASVRLEQRITSVDDGSLKSRIRWAASHDWIPPTIQRLFEEALGKLGGTD